MDFFRTTKPLPSAAVQHQIAAPRPLKHSGGRNVTFEPPPLSFLDVGDADDRMDASAALESLNEWQSEAEAELRQILGCCGFQTDSLFESTDEMSIEIGGEYPFNRTLLTDRNNDDVDFPRLGASPVPPAAPLASSPSSSYASSSSLPAKNPLAFSLAAHHPALAAGANATDFLFSSPPCRARNPVTCNTPFGLMSDDEFDVDSLLPLAQQLRLDLTINLPADAPRTRNRSYSEPVPFVPLVGS